jgi:vitamin B12 transporter
VSAVNAYWKAKVTRAWQSTLSFGRSEDLATNYTDGMTSSIIRTHQEQATWQNDLNFAAGNALIAVETLKQRISGSSTFVLQERSINSLSGGWNSGIGAHSFQINGRHDVNSQFGSRNTGNAAYGYRLASDWRTHIAYGTAFKAPTFNDLYFPFTANVGVGNPNLLPETSRNAEMGLRFDDGTQTASLTYFSNRIKNLIQWQESPVGSFFYTPFNVGEAKINGLTGDYQLKLGSWNLGTNLSLQDPKDAATGKQLNRRARAFGNVRISYTQNEWNFGAELQGTGSRWDDVANTQRMGGYTLVNLYASHALKRDWSVYGRIDNLFDRTYETAKSFGVPGASLTVGLRYDVK